MDTQIQQWNARGHLHNLDDLKEILNSFNTKVLCVQETHIEATHKNFLQQYTIFRRDREDAVASFDGTARIVDRAVGCQQLQLQMSLEAARIQAVIFNN